MKIPKNKVQDFKSRNNLTAQQHQYVDALGESNIPIGYWTLPFSKFAGPDTVKQATLSYIDNLKDSYTSGRNMCFAGNYGVGKTYAICSILKAALINGYSTYYTTLPEISMYITSKLDKDMYLSLLLKSDFLAIDEMDFRHIPPTPDAQAFFGSITEKVIRHRVQNKLPFLLATNHDSIEPVFTGQYGRAIDSLLAANCPIIPAMGKDFRKLK